MKPTVEQQADAMQVYNDYWHYYLGGNVEAMQQMLDEKYTQVGSAESEVFSNKKDAVQFLYDTIHEVAGQLEMRDRVVTREELNGKTILINEHCTIYAWSGDGWVFYSKFRASTLLQKKQDTWKILHQHSSFPDTKTEHGQNIGIDKISEENRELREAVKRRTIELEEKNRELAIEAALERVRAVAMSMTTANHLLQVAETQYDELKQLGIENIRNVMINTYEDDKDYFLDYDYSDLLGPSVTSISYNAHPIIEKNTLKLKKGTLNFFEAEVTGPDLETWIKARRNRGEKEDPRLNNIDALYYYFYSVGAGSIGLSSYNKLTGTQLNLLQRFRNVFDLAYKRYIDIATAEAQAREAQVEAALERVRSRSMGMQKSEELREIIKTVYQQLTQLQINLDHAGFVVDYTPKGDWHFWIADERDIPSKISHPWFSSVWANQFDEAKETGSDFFATYLNFEEKNKFYEELLSFVPGLPEASKLFYLSCPAFAASTVLLENVGLYIENFSGTPYSDEENKILLRFGRVFQQTYTRFLDLQKAEAQAREAQIETALEKVRSRSLAMHASNELQDVVNVVFERMHALNIDMNVASIFIFKEGSEDWEQWVASGDTNYSTHFNLPYTNNAIFNDLEDAKKNGCDFYNVIYSKEQKDNWFTYAFNNTEYNRIPDARKKFLIESEFYNVAFALSKNTGLQLAKYSGDNFSPDAVDILKRFAKVFEQTYTRFLDLQKAEAQAREAQIETALEKVRSRTMAMQKSEELPEAANVLFLQVQSLGIPAWSCGYNILAADKKSSTCIMSSEGEIQIPFVLPLTEHWSFVPWHEAIQNNLDFFTCEQGGEDLVEHYKYLAKQPGLEDVFRQFDKAGISLPTFQINHLVRFTDGFLLFITYEPVPHAHDIFKRFGRVFEQTYTRFLDLQKAEAQARESQIQLALERVRARTMAMQKSEDLLEVINVIYDQLILLGFEIGNAGFLMEYRESNDGNIWMKDATTEFPTQQHLPWFDHPFNDDYLDQRDRQTELFTKLYPFEEKNTWWEFILAQLPGVSSETRKALLSSPGLALSRVLMKHIGLYLLNYAGTPYSKSENAILIRFGNVFEQTYTRFKDLKKAETQALEAIKRASVDRVRAEIASMRTTKDLERITPLIWNELTTLGIPFIRCGVFIMDEEQQQIETHLSTPGGEAIATFNLPYNGPGETTQILAHWYKKKLYKQRWNEIQFIEFTQDLVKQGAITSGEKYLTENHPSELFLHFIPFLQGMLYVGDTAPLNDDALNLVQNLADAFSTAYARYEDFNKLEAALNELQATQRQLIQSEKMASLGELTAGIAHEIQNPLNFVNNFSEVNVELIEELRSEKSKVKSERDEALEQELLNDIAENERKINHHGKRADAIVKGMLQHSRSSSGVKEPTDINALCEEYLRLSYHGLRAKDKSFNATLNTDFDASIGKLNIIPQDIGRVILNLINNAFYAVDEKKKQAGAGYSPTVTVGTKLLSPSGGSRGAVEISVADNGDGIPQKIVEKMFQPFFTTKPTGQGTGLGLSLSYDIVKAHGGEIKVETEEGKRSVFNVHLPFAG